MHIKADFRGVPTKLNVTQSRNGKLTVIIKQNQLPEELQHKPSHLLGWLDVHKRDSDGLVTEWSISVMTQKGPQTKKSFFDRMVDFVEGEENPLQKQLDVLRNRIERAVNSSTSQFG